MLGAAARIVAVRAKPRIGGSDGNAATKGLRVKPPVARRPSTISIALQMVAVSTAVSAAIRSGVSLLVLI